MPKCPLPGDPSPGPRRSGRGLHYLLPCQTEADFGRAWSAAIADGDGTKLAHRQHRDSEVAGPTLVGGTSPEWKGDGSGPAVTGRNEWPCASDGPCAANFPRDTDYAS